MSSGKKDHDDAGASPLLLASVRRFLSEHQLRATVDVRDEDGRELDAARQARLTAVVSASTRTDQELVTLAGLGELATGICHEARNVLTAALSFAQIGKRRAAADEAKGLFGEVESQLLRTIDLLSELLVIARNKSSNEARSTGPVDLGLLADKVVKLVRPQLKLKRVRVRVESETEDPWVWADERDVFQILLNLLINALHATLQNGDVVVHVGQDGNSGKLRITNTGPRIPDDVCDALFEPFFTTKAAGQGTGLGLAVSRRLAEANHGSLWVVRGKAEGAEFVLSLPRATPRREEDET